jgi:hypothetical protein
MVFGAQIMKKAVVLPIAFLLFSIPLIALDRNDLLFYASLDERLEADFARGETAPLKPPRLTFAKGIKGAGVIATERITWDGKENILAEEGTFSFWLSPVDWSSGDGRSHHFAWLGSTNGSTRIYQYYPGNLGMLMQPKGGTRTCWVYYGVHEGKFTHVAFTWRPGEWRLYLDGYPRQRVTDSFVPFGEIRHFQLGDGNTVFDELMVFGRALSDEEIRALYYRVKLPLKKSEEKKKSQ